MSQKRSYKQYPKEFKEEAVALIFLNIKLVELDKLGNLPQINLPDEELALAIKRFDRADDQRIHMEDFAQILVKYPHEKYKSAQFNSPVSQLLLISTS